MDLQYMVAPTMGLYILTVPCTRMAQVVMLPTEYLLVQLWRYVNTISEADYILIFYEYVSVIFRVLPDPFSLASVFSFISLIFCICSGNISCSTGTTGSIASTSSTMSLCLGSLLSASTTTFLGPLIYLILGPYSSRISST